MMHLPVGLRRASRYTCGGLLAMWAATVPAADKLVAVSVGAGYSDNIDRFVTGTQSSWFSLLGLDVSLSGSTRRTVSSVVGSLNYSGYSQGDRSGELLGRVTVRSVFSMIPDRFTWTLEDNFGQVLPDLFQPPSPANRDNINYASFGPDLTARLSETGRVVLNGRFSRVDYKDSPSDNNRVGGSVALVRQSSPSVLWSLNLRSEKVAFDGTANADFTVQQAFARYDLRGGGTTLSLDGGANRLDRSGSSTSGSLFRFDLVRRLTERSTVSVRGGRELTDSAGTLRSNSGYGDVSRLDGSLGANAEPLVRKHASLAYDASGLRTVIGGSLIYSDEHYIQSSGVDRQRMGAEVHASRALGPRLRASVQMYYTEDEFSTAVPAAHEVQGSVGLSWQPGRRISAGLNAERYSRGVSGARGNAVENRFWLRLRYGDAAAGSVPISSAASTESAR